MRLVQKKSFLESSKIKVWFWFRKFPALAYLFRWSLICVAIGGTVGSASAGFLQTLDWVTNFREEHLWIVAFLPVAGFFIGLLYHHFGKEIEAGNNLLIDTIHDPKQIIPFRLAPFVYIGTLATHVFGGSAGREGTALQMAGAISDQFNWIVRFTNEERKILIISSIAAGFGSVFGTPLAGAIFGLEVVLIGRLRYNAIFPAFGASVLADVVTRFWQTPHTHHPIGFVPPASFLTVMYAVLAGIAFGLCASFFSFSIHKATTIFKTRIKYPPLRPLIGGILVGLAVWALGTSKYIGLGIPTMVSAFDSPLPAQDFLLKLIFTVITLSAGFKGGEVTPLFFIGATLGSALSTIIPLPTGILAGMGFVAVFAGATNTPLASTVMAMELFGSECGIFVSIACVVSYMFSGHSGIYSSQRIGESKFNRFETQQIKIKHEL